MGTFNAAQRQLPTQSTAEISARSVLFPLESWYLLLRFATVMAALFAMASFPRSAFFPIREMTVLGAHHVPVAEVIARSELRVGDSLFGVPAEEVAGRLMRHPRIASAEVGVGYAGQVVIQITERTPYAALTVNGGYLLLDRTGLAIDHQDGPGGLPIIRVEGLKLPWAQLGTRIASMEVAYALAALQMLPEGIARNDVLLRVQAGGDLSMVTADRLTILLGQPRGLQERLALLQPLLQAVRRQLPAIEYLDLRFAGNAIAKPARTPAPSGGVRP